MILYGFHPATFVLGILLSISSSKSESSSPSRSFFFSSRGNNKSPSSPTIVATKHRLEESLSSLVPSSSSDARTPLNPPESPRLKPRVICLNIMVAGLSGLGKTTTCASLLDAWTTTSASSASGTSTSTALVVKNSPFRKSSSSSYTSSFPYHHVREPTLIVDPSRQFERYDPDSNTILKVKLIDTPGFGNRVNHGHSVHPILHYITSCRKRYYQRETSKTGINVHIDPDTNDELVHVCLYFLSPGRFLEMDRHFLQTIQKDVSIVPVIAKADTMTDDEISEYRASLRHIFQQERIRIYDFDKRGDGYSNNRTNNNNNNNGGTGNQDLNLFRRGRRPGEPLAIISRDGAYPWGQSDSLDPNHSDLTLIRDLLLSQHTERLIELAHAKYAIYRYQRIGRRRYRDALRYITLAVLIAQQACLLRQADGTIGDKNGIFQVVTQLSRTMQSMLGSIVAYCITTKSKTPTNTPKEVAVDQAQEPKESDSSRHRRGRRRRQRQQQQQMEEKENEKQEALSTTETTTKPKGRRFFFWSSKPNHQESNDKTNETVEAEQGNKKSSHNRYGRRQY